MFNSASICSARDFSLSRPISCTMLCYSNTQKPMNEQIDRQTSSIDVFNAVSNSFILHCTGCTQVSFNQLQLIWKALQDSMLKSHWCNQNRFDTSDYFFLIERKGNKNKQKRNALSWCICLLNGIVYSVHWSTTKITSRQERRTRREKEVAIQSSCMHGNIF